MRTHSLPHAFWLYLLQLLLLHEHLVNCLSAVGDATLADMFAVMNGFKENQSRCYSFDVRASGFVASEGCVAVAISSGREGSVNNTARLLSSVVLCVGQDLRGRRWEHIVALRHLQPYTILPRR